MGLKRNKAPQVDVVEDSTVVDNPHVTQDLTIDPNDPRKFPPVDGANQPQVDINVPIEGVKEAA